MSSKSKHSIELENGLKKTISYFDELLKESNEL